MIDGGLSEGEWIWNGDIDHGLPLIQGLATFEP